MSWKKEIKEISLRKKLALGQGGKEAIDIQHAKGRLTLRERIDLILDKIIHSKLLDIIGVIVIHRHKNSNDKIPSELKMVKTKNYGLSKIIFLKFA